MEAVVFVGCASTSISRHQLTICSWLLHSPLSEEDLRFVFFTVLFWDASYFIVLVCFNDAPRWIL